MMDGGKRSPSKEYRFFIYEPSLGQMRFYSSKEERDEEAQKSIHDYLNHDGWMVEEVEGVCAGEVTAIAGVTRVEPRPPDDEIDEEDIDESGEYWEPDCDEKCYYGMVEIGQ